MEKADRQILFECVNAMQNEQDTFGIAFKEATLCRQQGEEGKAIKQCFKDVGDKRTFDYSECRKMADI